VIINVIDANNLERSLYLTTQLLELNIPVILAVNMLDVAKKRGITIDIKKLSVALGCPAAGVIATKKEGINGLKDTILDSRLRGNDKINYPTEIKQAINFLTNNIDNKEAYFLSIRLLEDDLLARQKVPAEILAQAKKSQQLNRILGIPIFLAVMYLMFFFAVNIGGIAQDYFQKSSDVIFVSGFAHLLSGWQLPPFLIAILTTGLGKGINTTLTFIPVLTTMFLFLALLEATGYMARAGFVVDRLMCAIGLPGKSFVPMLIGFGCNVPAIMASRTLENKRDRILTIMMTPFMSCTARLAIYAVFTAAFFPHGRQNIVFALYVIGILVAVLTGLILRKTILSGRQSALVMELPTYHLPTIRDVLFQTWCRLKAFICKAGKVIIPACIIISLLNNIHINNKDSLLATAGKKVTPILKPIGIEQNNWPATVGLVTGVIAKEVVVATLNTLYKAHNGIYGQMYERFNGKAAAFAYLLFVLLYFPCIPALATILQELGWRWATFSMLWNTGIAYCTATVFYQTVTFTDHPIYAGISLSAIIIAFLSVVLTMRWLSKKEES
jgi:ferrous iron transport protein B